MRVALLCPYSLSRPGGVQGQVVGLAGALAAAGHDAVVLAPSDPDLDVAGLASGSFVSLGRSVGLRANGSVAPVALGPGAALRAVRTVRDGRFDVVHLHEPLAPGPGYACLLAAGPPKVGTFHRAGPSVAYRLLGPVARRLAARLAARCAVSPAARATAQDALGGTYEIIGNGIDLDRFATAPPCATELPTMMFVGRHEARKGLGVLLEAMAHIDPGVPLQLWVAGEGPDTEELRRRYGSDGRLVWLGRIDDDELAARLSGAQVLCAPALRGESFGVVLLEAMAARTAIVASDIPGYAAVVGDHGVLVPPGDVGSLARALRTVADDAARGTGVCGAAALDAAFEHASQWSMDRVAQRYVTVYERVVGSAAPGH